MDKSDEFAEYKAFYILISLMCIDVDNVNGEEPYDMCPFLRACMHSKYFGMTTRALAAMYFGVARSEVSSIAVTMYYITTYSQFLTLITLQIISNLSICVKSTKNDKTFCNNILRFITKSSNGSGVRCLQYLSIIIFFQIIVCLFIEKEEALKITLEEYSVQCKKKKIRCDLIGSFEHYRNEVLDGFFDNNTSTEKKVKQFQTSFGYTLFVKYLIQFCGQSFTKFLDRRKASINPKKPPVMKCTPEPTIKKRKAAPIDKDKNKGPGLPGKLLETTVIKKPATKMLRTARADKDKKKVPNLSEKLMETTVIKPSTKTRKAASTDEIKNNVAGLPEKLLIAVLPKQQLKNNTTKPPTKMRKAVPIDQTKNKVAGLPEILLKNSTIKYKGKAPTGSMDDINKVVDWASFGATLFEKVCPDVHVLLFELVQCSNLHMIYFQLSKMEEKIDQVQTAMIATVEEKVCQYLCVVSVPHIDLTLIFVLSCQALGLHWITKQTSVSIHWSHSRR